MKCKKIRKGHRGKKLFFILIVAGILVGSLFQFQGQSADTRYDWNLILVNRNYKVPENYKVNLTELSNGQRVDSRCYPSLQQMFDDMRTEGVYPVAASGYRTSKKQKQLMDEKISELIAQGYSHKKAKKEAKKWVAAAGYSEHETGLAIDINGDGVNSSGEEVYDWLYVNAWRYGFILRYPKNKTHLTYIEYEPWHYRYVGVDAAAEMNEKGICLEEYLDTLD